MKNATKKALPKLHAAIVDKLPKEVALAGDLLYTTRQERLKVNKVVEALQAQESSLKTYIIDTLPKSKAEGATGKVAHVEIEKEDVAQVKPEDWEKVFTWILKNKAFDLLQRKLNQAAVEERWNVGKMIPGVSKFPVVKVSCTKKKGK